MPARVDLSACRYPNETLILTLTVGLVCLVVALTAAATLCTSVLLVLLAVGMAYYSGKSMHQELMLHAHPATALGTPDLANLVRQCTGRLRVANTEVFVSPSRELNAYTFGLTDPKSIVLYSSLFQVMDQDELRFILGHELGHVLMGHTWLNSLVGGMSGIPSSSGISAVLMLAFLWWNRACEYSADRVGLLACGNPNKAITALIKLVAGPQGKTHTGLEMAYRQIDAEDDTWLGSLHEALGTHPMLIRRIHQIQNYSRSADCQRLQALIDQNYPL